MSDRESAPAATVEGVAELVHRVVKSTLGTATPEQVSELIHAPYADLAPAPPTIDDLLDRIATLVGVAILPSRWHMMKQIAEKLEAYTPLPSDDAATKALDPEPWLSNYNSARSARNLNHYNPGLWRFQPNPEFEQDESKYPHRTGGKG